MNKFVLTLISLTVIQGCASFSDSLRDFAVGEEAQVSEQQAEEMAEKKAQEDKSQLQSNSMQAELEVDPNAAENDQAHMGEMPSMTMVETVSDAPERTNTMSPMGMVHKKQPSDAELRAEKQQMLAEQQAKQAEQEKLERAAKVQTRIMQKQQLGVPMVQANKQVQLRNSVENDYYVFQAVNHAHIRNNTPANQIESLNIHLSHFVMDMIANLAPEHYGAELVVRPLKLKVGDVANPEGGRELVTTVLAAQIRDYGFSVFDGRRPKGRFNGEELILETHIENYGEQFVLYGTLKQLGSNKVAATHQTFISDYFFRNIKDGVEVFETENQFGR